MPLPRSCEYCGDGIAVAIEESNDRKFHICAVCRDTCKECDQYGSHGPGCTLDPEYDPTPVSEPMCDQVPWFVDPATTGDVD